MSGTASAWVEFGIMAGTFLLLAIGMLVWVFYFRRHRHRRRKHRHRHQYRRSGVTLAQTGGLPPVRREEQPPDSPSSTYGP